MNNIEFENNSQKITKVIDITTEPYHQFYNQMGQDIGDKKYIDIKMMH